jgi:hypothetical protein
MRDNLTTGAWIGAALFFYWFGMACPVGKYRSDWSERIYSVEHFTVDTTLKITCSGDCDLKAMVAEAREAVK